MGGSWGRGGICDLGTGVIQVKVDGGVRCEQLFWQEIEVGKCLLQPRGNKVNKHVSKANTEGCMTMLCETKVEGGRGREERDRQTDTDTETEMGER